MSRSEKVIVKVYDEHFDRLLEAARHFIEIKKLLSEKNIEDDTLNKYLIELDQDLRGFAKSLDNGRDTIVATAA